MGSALLPWVLVVLLGTTTAVLGIAQVAAELEHGEPPPCHVAVTPPPFASSASVGNPDCPPPIPRSWEGHPSDQVALGRISLEDDGTFRFLGPVTILPEGDYVLDQDNRTLWVAYPVLRSERAAAVEVVRQDERYLAITGSSAAMTAGRGAPSLEYWHSPYLIILTPGMLRFELHFPQGCPSRVSGLDGTNETRHEGMLDFHAKVGGEPLMLRLEGEPHSICPPATLQLEALGLFARNEPEG